MGHELIIAIVGPLLGASLGVSTFFFRRSVARVDEQLASLSGNMEQVLEQVVDMKISTPEKYVSREELSFHISTVDRWQNDMTAQLREIKYSLENLRYNNSREYRQKRPNPHNIQGEDIYG